MNNIRWIDMIDPIYTLAKLAGVDPDEVTITGISILDSYMMIWYNDEKNVPRHRTIKYDL